MDYFSHLLSILWSEIVFHSFLVFSLTILRNIGEVFWRMFLDMGLPNDSLTLNWYYRFPVWFYHRGEAFLMTSYQGEWYPHYITGEDHLYLLLKAELVKFLYYKLECWIWHAVNNNYFYIFFSYFKVYISCLFDEYLLFQKFNIKKSN